MQTQATNDGPSGWDELRRLIDELEVRAHLGGLEMRERWRAVQPRLAEVEQEVTQTIDQSGDKLDSFLTEKISKLGQVLRKMRDDLVEHAAK